MLKQNLILILYFNIAAVLQINGIVADDSKNVYLKFFKSNDPKIINGTDATLNANRHQVSIRRRRYDSYFFGIGHICGGSLISENVVLSAAHCFVNYDLLEPTGVYGSDEDFIVVMGDLNRFEYNNNTLVFDIKKIVKRVEIFNLKTFDDDLVLIILNGTVPATHPTVRPIILNDGPLTNNTICQVTGWGKTEKEDVAETLKTVDVPIIDFDDCREKTEYGFAVRKGMICAGYLNGEKDACKGDSGGPLRCHGLQAGVVSWGSGCAESLHPGVYTDVAYHKNWILKEVANNNGTLPKFISNDVGELNDTDGSGDGVASLNFSLVVVSLMLILNFHLSLTK